MVDLVNSHLGSHMVQFAKVNSVQTEVHELVMGLYCKKFSGA